jgi:hypothetical protein
MASYNSTRGNCKGFLPVPVLNDENARNNERTPLLSVPDNILCQGSAGVLIEAPPPRSWSGEPESCLVNEETRPLPVLSKFTSNTPLGMEAKAIPATANSPDGNGDLQLPTSVDDSLILTIIRQGTDEENQRNFHGGVTQGQFWIIFSGICFTHLSVYQEFLELIWHIGILVGIFVWFFLVDSSMKLTIVYILIDRSI